MYLPIAERKSSFKKGLDACEGRRNRNETTINLRKNKREEGLAKRRAMVTPTVPAAFEASTTTTSDDRKTYTVADISELAASLAKPNIIDAKLLEVARAFRKILSVENNVPVKKVLDSGVLPALVQMISCGDKPDIQFEAAWALTNIASTDYTRVVADAGAIPIFVNLLSNPVAEIRDQSAWCLGNIAGDCPELRDMVLNAGAMQPLIQNVMTPSNPTLLNNCVWALSNFCRGKPAPAVDMVASAIPVLASILAGNNNDEAKSDALWALSYISDGNDERIQTVIDCDGVVALLVEILGSDLSNAITPALRTIGNIVSGEDPKYTQTAIDAGLMRKMPLLLQNAKKSIRKEACWVLSNVAAGTQDQIQTIFKGGLVHVVQLAEEGEYEVRKEAIWTLGNVATGGTATQVMSLVECGAIDALCSILNVNDSKILMVALDAIENILKTAEACGKNYVSFVDECGGLQMIEALQEHQEDSIYSKCIDIIETYFGEDDDAMEENLVPATDGDMFTFGISQKGLEASLDEAARPMQFNF